MLEARTDLGGGVRKVISKDIPQELVDILDDRAGKIHSRSGPVVSCLAEILTKYEEIKFQRLEEIMARFFLMYPIPANGLDTQAQMMRVKLGMAPGDRFEVAEEMAKGWASSIMKMIREEVV